MSALGALALASFIQGSDAKPLQISESGKGAYEASVATTADGVAVAWYDTRATYAQIYARLLGQNLQPTSPEMQLTQSKAHAYEPDLQVAGENLIVAWYEKDVRTRALTAKVGAWTSAGTPLWTTQLSSPRSMGRNPVVRVSDQGIFCAWVESPHGRGPFVTTIWLDANGQPLAPPRSVARASRTTWNLNSALDDAGRAWVVFDARQKTRRSELYLVVAERASSSVRRLSRDDGFESVYPDIALNGAQVALTWFDVRKGKSDVYLFAGRASELLAEDAASEVGPRARRVTGEGNSIGAYVTWNAGRGGLAWSNDSSRQYEIYFEPFGANGEALAEPQRLTDSPAWSLIPAIRPWGDAFVIAWNEYEPAHRKARSEVEVVRAP